MSMEALQAQEDLMKSIESFLKKFNRISFGKTPKVLLQAWDNFFEVKHAQSEEVQELLSKLVQDVKIISDELSEYINTPAWNRPLVYCDNDDDEDYTIAITPESPTKEPVNSLSLGDEHLDTILATESDEVIKSSVEDLLSKNTLRLSSISTMILLQVMTILPTMRISIMSPPDAEIVSSRVVEIVIPEVRGIDIDILLTIKEDILREKLLNVNLLIANIEALKDNTTPSSDFVTKSPSTFPNPFLEETNTFDNSLTKSETFCFNLEEISSGSTTTRSDYSQYDSFIFDLSIDSFPPADRSDLYHEEFAGELAHIISPPGYDHFCFKIEPELGNLTMDVVGIFFQQENQ
ncbi:hypothetical protein Tco_1545364, partial [Tanacetum coccineum]